MPLSKLNLKIDYIMEIRVFIGMIEMWEVWLQCTDWDRNVSSLKNSEFSRLTLKRKFSNEVSSWPVYLQFSVLLGFSFPGVFFLSYDMFNIEGVKRKKCGGHFPLNTWKISFSFFRAELGEANLQKILLVTQWKNLRAMCTRRKKWVFLTCV